MLSISRNNYAEEPLRTTASRDIDIHHIRIDIALDIRHLMHDAPGPEVEEAWRITLENLDGIFDLARAHDIPVALVVFPDLLQWSGIGSRDQPQRILTAHARARDIPVLDLLPP